MTDREIPKVPETGSEPAGKTDPSFDPQTPHRVLEVATRERERAELASELADVRRQHVRDTDELDRYRSEIRRLAAATGVQRGPNEDLVSWLERGIDRLLAANGHSTAWRRVSRELDEARAEVVRLRNELERLRGDREIERQADQATAGTSVAPPGVHEYMLVVEGTAYLRESGATAGDPLAHRGVVRPDVEDSAIRPAPPLGNRRVGPVLPGVPAPSQEAYEPSGGLVSITGDDADGVQRRWPVGVDPGSGPDETAVTVYQSTDGVTWAPHVGFVGSVPPVDSEDIERERARLARGERIDASVRADGRADQGGWRFDAGGRLVQDGDRKRARYPLLVHPADVGSRAPLDPIEARTCRRLRPSEVLDVGSIKPWLGDGLWSAVGAAVSYGRFPGKAWGTLAMSLLCSEQDATEALRDAVDVAEAIDGVLRLDAWVCEGDEPAAEPLYAETESAEDERVRREFEGGDEPSPVAVTPSPASRPEPPPVASTGPAIWPLVCADLRADFGDMDAMCAECMERDAFGRAKYGTPLQAHNGRRPLVDAYQEALDLVVYLRQALIEGSDVASDYNSALRLAVNLHRRLPSATGEGG